MPDFEAPDFTFSYDLNSEIAGLRQWRDTEPGRAIPNRQVGRLLLGSWNIANLGSSQIRSDDDIQIMAEILSWFDLIALQEVRDDLTDLRRIMLALPDGYEMITSDKAGNNERMCYVYDASRVARLELAGEIAIPVASHRYIKLPDIEQKFRGFDRNPYAVAFQVDDFRATIANAHSYFGSGSKQSVNRRALETYAVGRWADLRRKRDTAYTQNTIVIGDLNMPLADVGDEIFDALTKRGLVIPEHQSHIGTVITEGKYYDQLAFFPGDAGAAFLGQGVFDFDSAIFPQLWQDRGRDDFNAFLRYRLSDHRPIWAQFQTI